MTFQSLTLITNLLNQAVM